MSRHDVVETPPRAVFSVEIDPHADMHNPERPYCVTVWEPEGNVQDDDRDHACRNVNREELTALWHAIGAVLQADEAAQ